MDQVTVPKWFLKILLEATDWQDEDLIEGIIKDQNMNDWKSKMKEYKKLFNKHFNKKEYE